MGFEPETIKPIQKTTGFTPDIVGGFEPLPVDKVPQGQEIIKQNNEWLNQIVSPKQIEDWKSKGTIGAGEAAAKLNKWEMVPFLNTVTLKDDISVLKAFHDSQAGEPLSESQKQSIQEYVLDMAEIQARGYSIGGQITDAALRMPAYIGEIGAAVFTGGLVAPSLFGKQAAKVGAKQGTKAAVKNILKKVGKAAAMGGVATTVMPHRVAKNATSNYLNDTIAITDKGQVFYREAEKSPATYAMRALGDVYIENFSEFTGAELLSPLTKGLGKGAKKVLPKSFVANFAKLAESTTNLKIQEAFKKFGWNGLVNEIGEERVGDLLRTSFDLDQEEGYSTDQFLKAMFPDAEDLLVEIGVLSIFAGSSRATQALTNKLRSKGIPEDKIQETVQNMTEIDKDKALENFDLQLTEAERNQISAVAENQIIDIENLDQEGFIEKAKNIKEQLQTVSEIDPNQPKTMTKAMGYTPVSISQYIKNTGGIVDKFGELKARDITTKNGVGIIRKPTRDASGQISMDGKTASVPDNENIDFIKERLFDAGYFNDKNNYNEISDTELYDAIASDINGERVYTTKDTSTINELTQYNINDMYDAMGISQTDTIDEIANVLRKEAGLEPYVKKEKINVEEMALPEKIANDKEIVKDIKTAKQNNDGLKSGDMKTLMKPQSSLSKFGSDVGLGFEKILTPISTRVKNISPQLFVKLRKYEEQVKIKTIANHKDIEPFLAKLKTLDNDSKVALDLALKNGDKKTINEIANAYDMVKEVEQVKAVLDDLFDRATKVGIDVQYKMDFFPRKVKDLEGLMDHLHGSGYWSIIQEAIKSKEVKKDRKLTQEERVTVINQLLRGYSVEGVSLATRGQFKERSIKKINAGLNQFYETSDQSLLSYIYVANESIETATLFGRGTEVNKQENMEDSIGSLVDSMIESDEINSRQARILKDILAARFNEGRMSGIMAGIRDLSYIDVMGSPLNAVTQIGDTATSLYNSGFLNTIKEIPLSVANKSKITLEDIGINSIAHEYENFGWTSNAVDKVFTMTGLKKIDSIGKLTLVNSALRKYQQQAKSNNKKLDKELDLYFEVNANQVKQDLIDGKITEDVKFLLFNKLLDMQPMAKSEMPENYLRSGNWKIAYMLKTFTIRQLDIYRREVFSKLVDAKQTGNSKLAAEAIGNFVRLYGFWVAMGASADWIKDSIRSFFGGDEMDEPEDYVLDNMLKAFGWSRYQSQMFAKQGGVEVIGNLIQPPAKFLTNVQKDAKKLADGELNLETSKSIRSIPVGGELYYFWFGAGSDGGSKNKEFGK